MNQNNETQLSLEQLPKSQQDIKQLCQDLMLANTEASVINILKQHGYWDNPNLWRYYGDKESNFSTIGNQSSSPEAALVEKVVNSIDAVLMNECWLSGSNPTDPQAPNSIKEAVAKYFGDTISRMGNIANWPTQKRTEISKRVTVAATGSRSGNPCFIIADNGEGQTPDLMAETLLSLDRRNKVSVHFVQGTFNMGGTGVLRFCGEQKLQLVISKRNPSILNVTNSDARDNMWGFTIVRRENPPPGEKNSIYTYLAPGNGEGNPRKGNVLCFVSDGLNIFPNGNQAFVRDSKWGTLIKLYEYQATGFRSNILMPDGLLSKLDILLPDIALPIRLYECRDYKGEVDRSFETTVAGLSVRLGDDRAKNLEEGFPDAGQFMVKGQRMTYTVYAFKTDRGKTYKTSREGIVFTINGQTHATLSSDFFTRTNVKKGRLKNSILVIVDCSGLNSRIREDLFPNSRDRLSKNDFREAMESQLANILLHHQGLRDLGERRRQEEFESAIADDKPIADAIQNILRSSPTLSSLFLTGTRLSNPFKTKEVSSADNEFIGRRHPSYFKFKKLDYGIQLLHKTPRNMRCRIIYETDVDNDYFARPDERGDFNITLSCSGELIEQTNYELTLRNGRAVLSLTLPENCIAGEELLYSTSVSDPTLLNDFINNFVVSVSPEQNSKGSNGSRVKNPTDGKGKDREKPYGLSIPEIREIHQPQWATYDFNKYSALKIIQEDPGDTPGENDQYDSNNDYYTYYVNVDNLYLQTEVKSSKSSAEMLKRRFVYGMVLLGMSLVYSDQFEKDTNKDAERDNTDSFESKPIDEMVLQISSSLAKTLLPMIDSLGSLSEESISGDYQEFDTE